MSDRTVHLPPLVPRPISFVTGAIAAFAAVMASVKGMQAGWTVQVLVSPLCYIIVLVICVGMLRQSSWIAMSDGSVSIGGRSIT